MFFWYFPAIVRTYQLCREGPSYSVVGRRAWGHGLYIAFHTAHGPVQVGLDGKLGLRDKTWTTNHSMIYVESYVGTGFSFTEDEAGYSTTSALIAENLYEFIQQFFTLFPERNANPFYVGGISYDGHIAPPVGKLLLERSQETPADKINFQKVLLFCPFADPINQMTYGAYYRSLGLITEAGLKHFEAEEQGMAELIIQDYAGAKKLNEQLVAKSTSYFANMTGFSSVLSVLEDNINLGNYGFVPLVQTPEFRRTLHVGNLSYDMVSPPVQAALANDFMTSVRPEIEEILRAGTQVMIVAGQLDLAVTGPGLDNMISKMSWPGRNEYVASEREIWRVGPDVAGYTKAGGNLSFVLVRNAGHLLIGDQEAWSLDLINKVSAKL